MKPAFGFMATFRTVAEPTKPEGRLCTLGIGGKFCRSTSTRARTQNT